MTINRREFDPAWEMGRTTQDAGLSNLPSNSMVGLSSLQAENLDHLRSVQAASVMPLLRLIGQVGSTYLVAEGPDGIYLIDQHAAHERVLFERFRAHMVEHLPAQALLEPATVQLPPQSANLLEQQLPFLEKLGFQVEIFGQNTFLIRSIPTLILGSDPTAALLALVEDFEEDESPLQDEVEARLTARICKRAAVKAGQVLSLEEQRALLDGLENCASPRTCPHGRPTMIHLSADLLERQFGRRGAR
jgi:DNA mismatch repair protein MutL